MLSATTARPQLAASFRPTAARNGQQLSRARAPLRLYATAEQQEERSLAQKLAAPAAAVLGAALLFGATPDMAEAARSGGRVGGSSGFSARRAAPPAASSSRTVIQNNTYVAPPVMGGWGFPGFGMPFFGGGFGIGFYPVFSLSTVFSLMIFMFLLNVAIGVVQGFTNQKKKSEFSDDDW
ncbi:hypothetical protein C2E21_6318 isoform A [Chlorella sorokiniana]|uniref:Uncharacterized protein n=1 Tax=Chlorella sorokiniana TaxID=3076 RepID=A0A2P6TL18_CHLSO|nr:hypothetical protein C2E21_6318 isoform A [Chlorella sorokiniana]|eukprot:PRW44981.1 hypothetical protein C2E21_6318 isoform A [Chlorella sorokiniana]